MHPYLNLLDQILDKGRWEYNERTKQKTLRYFGPQVEFDLSKGIPLPTTRKVPWKNAIKELLWFLSGSTDNRVLRDQKVPVWSLWDLTQPDMFAWRKKVDARGNPIHVGSCGPIYGQLWRQWPAHDGTTIDQIEYVLHTLRENPSSRRIVVSGWNPDVLPDEKLSPQENVLQGRQALAPCHTLFQFGTERLSLLERLEYYLTTLHDPYMRNVITLRIIQIKVDIKKGQPSFLKRCWNKFINKPHHSLGDEDYWYAQEYPVLHQAYHSELTEAGVPEFKLHLKLYARSQDVPLGTCFNIFSYATLCHMVAQQVNMIPGRYVHTIGDAHIYEDQLPGILELVKRKPRHLPRLKLRKGVKSLYDYTIDDFEIEGYDPHPPIKFPLTK